MQEADYELGTSQLSDLHTYTGKTADGLMTVQMPKNKGYNVTGK